MPTEVNIQFADVKRLAIPFENLRQDYAQIGAKIAVLTYGELKNFKARADYIVGFFATAGAEVIQSGELATIEAAQAWLTNAEYDYVVIAANDEDTKAVVPALLASKRASQIIDVAGKFKDEEAEWTANGLNGFIFAGQNIIEKLNAVAASMKEVQR